MHDHPQEAADVIGMQYPILDKAILLQQIVETNNLIEDHPTNGAAPDASHHKIGWLRPARMNSTLDFVSRAFAAGAQVKAADLYTNRFVE